MKLYEYQIFLFLLHHLTFHFPGHCSYQLTPQECAIAVLQIERGIDPKYLKEPLGCSTPVKRKTRNKAEDKEMNQAQSAILLSRWEKSLVHCTSISQVNYITYFSSLFIFCLSLGISTFSNA